MNPKRLRLYLSSETCFEYYHEDLMVFEMNKSETTEIRFYFGNIIYMDF